MHWGFWLAQINNLKYFGKLRLFTVWSELELNLHIFSGNIMYNQVPILPQWIGALWNATLNQYLPKQIYMQPAWRIQLHSQRRKAKRLNHNFVSHHIPGCHKELKEAAWVLSIQCYLLHDVLAVISHLFTCQLEKLYFFMESMPHQPWWIKLVPWEHPIHHHIPSNRSAKILCARWPNQVNHPMSMLLYIFAIKWCNVGNFWLSIFLA